MTITEYIAALEAIRAEHGDLEVWEDDSEGHAWQPVPRFALLTDHGRWKSITQYPDPGETGTPVLLVSGTA